MFLDRPLPNDCSPVPMSVQQSRAKVAHGIICFCSPYIATTMRLRRHRRRSGTCAIPSTSVVFNRTLGGYARFTFAVLLVVESQIRKCPLPLPGIQNDRSFEYKRGATADIAASASAGQASPRARAGTGGVSRRGQLFRPAQASFSPDEGLRRLPMPTGYGPGAVSHHRHPAGNPL